MKWTVVRRETGLVEHIDESGVGHPNFYSAVRLNDYKTNIEDNTWFIHGCNGNCSREDFPGRRMPTLEKVADLMYWIQRSKDPHDKGVNDFTVRDMIVYASHDIWVNNLLEGRNEGHYQPYLSHADQRYADETEYNRTLKNLINSSE